LPHLRMLPSGRGAVLEAVPSGARVTGGSQRAWAMGELAAGIAGHRHGRRVRSLMGTFGRTEIAVPRVGWQTFADQTSSRRSSSLPDGRHHGESRVPYLPATREKRTSGLPTSSVSRPETHFERNATMQYLYVPESAPRKFQSRSGQHPSGGHGTSADGSTLNAGTERGAVGGSGPV
jgi:hypothetical protein